MQQDKKAGERDDGLEGVQGNRVGAVGHFANADGVAGIRPAGPCQGDHAWHEEQDVQHKVKRSLCAWLGGAIKEIAAHVAVLAQCVSAAHHEGAAVQHVAGFKNPSCRGVQGVAFENFAHHHDHQHNDQPCEGFAHPCTDVVYCV